MSRNNRLIKGEIRLILSILPDNLDMMAAGLKWRMAAMVVVGLVLNVDRVKTSEGVMRNMSKTFFKVMNECKNELSISADMVESLVKFWGEDSDHRDHDLGCLILCLAQKQDLTIEDQTKIHHKNMYQYARDHGADEDTAKQINSFFHECEQLTTPDQDKCWEVMTVAQCFRDHLHRLKWAPTVDVLVDEILTEIF